MFIRYFLDLAVPLDEVEAALLAEPSSWVPGLARDAQDRGEHLLAEVGFDLDEHRIDKEVLVEIGTPHALPWKTMLPISWTATGPERAFPALDADIEIAALGANRTQLSISARYRPPFGALGRAVDKAILHRVAEATVKDFLDGVGARLQARVSRVADD